MSYAFDVMSRVFETQVRPRIDERLAVQFSELIDAMHSANHRVPSADGIFKGDGVNKDSGVSRAARELDDYSKLDRCETCGGSVGKPAGCRECCRDCGRPCAVRKDGEGFHHR